MVLLGRLAATPGAVRSGCASDPLYYARLTVKKAQADMGRESVEATSVHKSEQTDFGGSSLDKSSGTRG
jgi:hypothetical protein